MKAEAIKINVLGVNFDKAGKEAILRTVQVYLKEKRKFFIVTPNPEQVMLAQKNINFRRILNDADVSLPDGIGIPAAHKFLTLPQTAGGTLGKLQALMQGALVGVSIIFNRKWVEKDLKVIRGREFFMDLIKLANKKGLRVYLLGGERNESEGTRKRIQASYKNLVVKSSGGPIVSDSGNPDVESEKKKEREVVNEISRFSPHLLFVAFGAPKQEMWVYKFLPKLRIGGAMVVGSTFKYESGIAKVSPPLIANLGMEWFWRLLTGSQKTERIVKAFPGFPLTVYQHKTSEM